MKVIDPGHVYELESLDGEFPQTLTFVKREGPKFPGNVGHHPGTTLQDVLRALLDRMHYLQNQIPCEENHQVITDLEDAIYVLEARAAARHGRSLEGIAYTDVVNGNAKCPVCGHIGCTGNCHAQTESQT